MNKLNLTTEKLGSSSQELFSCSVSSHYPVEVYRAQFPILQQQVHGHPLVYLDSAASAQKPKMVIEAMTRFLEEDYANIHRGVHELSMRSTKRYEAVRTTVRRFLNASCDEEIVFVRGATEAINLVASSWGGLKFQEGDEVVLSTLEHHANIVPWQMLRERLGIVLKIVPMTDDGRITSEAFLETLSPKTKFVALTHVSNALGTILPIKEFIEASHVVGAKVLIDGCQAVSHMPVDVQALDADFYVFSGHKIYGPSGIGVLYGRLNNLKEMPPWQGGGDMISQVTFAKTTYRDPPYRFEAGTPPITEVIGLGAALEYLMTIGVARIGEHENRLLALAERELHAIPGVHILGPHDHKAGIISFTVDGIHPHDLGTVLDHHGVAIRAGHHCAQPLMERLGVIATARASFGLYTNESDIVALRQALYKAKELFS